LHLVCSQAIAGFKALTVMLSPVLPALASRVARELFGLDRDFTWDDVAAPSPRIAAYQHLMQRVDPKQLDALFETPEPAATSSGEAATADGAETVAPGGEAIADTITITDFAKVDLRVARIVACDYVDGADKLLRLTLDVGEGHHRNVFAGIRDRKSTRLNSSHVKI